MGIGDWGLGIGELGFGVGGHPHTPNTKTTIHTPLTYIFILFFFNIRGVEGGGGWGVGGWGLGVGGWGFGDGGWPPPPNPQPPIPNPQSPKSFK